MSATTPDRRVIIVLSLVVTIILALNVASALVPGMDGLLASVPVIVAILVGGTIVVMVSVLRGRG